MSAVHDKNVYRYLDPKTDKDKTKFQARYRGKKAGKKVQAAKQAQIQKVKNVKRNCSTIKEAATLLQAIVEECTYTSTQSQVKSKYSSRGSSHYRESLQQGHWEQGTRADKHVEVEENIKKVAQILNALG